MNEYIICFNSNGQSSYQIVKAPSKEEAIIDVRNQGVKKDIEFVFNIDSDEFIQERQERDDFDMSCYRFGLFPEDYGKTIKCSDDEIYSIVGFEPNRRKYTIRLRNTIDKKIRVATPNYVRKQLDITANM